MHAYLQCARFFHFAKTCLVCLESRWFAPSLFFPQTGARRRRVFRFWLVMGGDDKCRRFATRRFLALSLNRNDCAGRAKYDGRTKPLGQNALCFLGRCQSFKKGATSGELLVMNFWNYWIFWSGIALEPCGACQEIGRLEGTAPGDSETGARVPGRKRARARTPRQSLQWHLQVTPHQTPLRTSPRHAASNQTPCPHAPRTTFHKPRQDTARGTPHHG